jgi:hypothetical protein
MLFDRNQWITIIVALIAAGGPTGTAVFALISSDKRLDYIARRLDRIEIRLDKLYEKRRQREGTPRTALEERAGVISTR